MRGGGERGGWWRCCTFDIEAAMSHHRQCGDRLAERSVAIPNVYTGCRRGERPATKKARRLLNKGYVPSDVASRLLEGRQSEEQAAAHSEQPAPSICGGGRLRDSQNSQEGEATI